MVPRKQPPAIIQGKATRLAGAWSTRSAAGGADGLGRGLATGWPRLVYPIYTSMLAKDEVAPLLRAAMLPEE